MTIYVFHYYNIYTLLCASTSCLISHDARIIPSSTERSCITIEHSYYKNNSDHLLSYYNNNFNHLLTYLFAIIYNYFWKNLVIS